nr:MAG TPA: hypothetical protein [Caudoviricetes sp.]
MKNFAKDLNCWNIYVTIIMQSSSFYTAFCERFKFKPFK